MTPHLIPHYGPHALGLIIARRPMAYPGIYAPGAARASLCDWFDPAPDANWRDAAGGAGFAAVATGGWRAATMPAEWAAPGGDGWRTKKPCA
jgi:hypothetical protein